MQRFEEDIKSSVFNVIYILLKDDETTFWKFFFVIIIDFLQILLYSFHQNLESAWKSDDVLSYIQTFLSFTHFVPWLKDLDLVTYLVIFYICVSIVALVILDFFYVTYTQNNKKFSFAWPIQALRSLCFLIRTLLFLPFLETFLSMLVCHDKDGISYHYAFDDFECWTGQHIIHAAFALLSLILFLSLSIIISLTYYKPLSSSLDATARINSRADTFFMIEKIILAIVFSYLGQADYNWVLISILCLMSIISFSKFYLESPYHNERLTIVINITQAIFAWANIVLVIAKILAYTSFNGGLQLFLLGIPMIIALLIFNRDNRIDQLLQNLGSFLKGEEVQKQARFFLQIISAKDQDRNADIILKGYVYNHEDTCPNAQCQLKQYKSNLLTSNSSKSMKDKKKKQFQQQQLQIMQNLDNQQLLLQHAKNMYRSGIQKFPNDSALRIQYAFFLVEKMNKKQEALQELAIAATLNPPFDEQFIIFRYRKLADEFGDASSSFSGSGAFGEDQSKSNSKQNADMLTRFAFESSYRHLQNHIERCAQYHLEFWNLLRDDRPDVAKLGECGSKINQSISHVDNLWNALQKVNSNVPKALRLYGKYLIEILYDREGGLDLMARAKDATNVKNNYYDGGMNVLDDVNDIQAMSSDGTPCIYVSGDLDKIGMITQSNAGATRIFGYTAFEIKNHNVERLMPDMYAKNHSKVLEDALMKGSENIPNKERLVFAKHKSGYVFPVWLQLKMVSNMVNGVQFVAMFKVDKKLMSAQIGYVLLNKEKKIQGISSSCIKLMNLDNNRIKRITANGYDLHKIAPDIFTGEELYAQNNKQGHIIEWTIPKFERNKNYQAQNYKQGTLRPQGGRGSKDGGSRFQSNGMQPRQFQGQGSLQVKNLDDDSSSAFNTNGRSSIKFNNTPVQQPYTITEQKFTFSCSVSTIIMGELGEIGWYIRLDQLQDQKKKQDLNTTPFQGAFRKDNNNRGGGGGGFLGREKMKQPLFQFRFDSDNGRFVRELKESLTQDTAGKDPNFINGYYTGNYIDFGNSSPKDKHDDDVISIDHLKVKDNTAAADDSKDVSALNTSIEHSPTPNNEDMLQARKRWGRGITIYRLVNGKFQSKDQDDDQKKEKQIEDDRKRKNHLEEQNFMQLDTFKNNIKSRKALHMAINDTSVPQAIRNLRMTMNFVIMCLLALAIAEFTIITGEFRDINENFNLIQKSYKRMSEMHRIAYNVRSLVLINEGRITNLTRYSTAPDFREYLKTDMEQALNNIYTLQNDISLSTLTVSDAHQRLLSEKLVPLYYKESNTTFKILNFSLTEAVLQVSSAVFTVRHLNNSQYFELQEDVYFVTYNVFNDFLIYLRHSSDYYLEELIDRSDAKTLIILILFLSSTSVIILSIPILFPSVSSVNKAKVHVLSLFVDIPNHYVIDLGNKCEEFLNSYHDEQKLDEMKSEDEDLDLVHGANHRGESGGKPGAMKRNIHKQAKNTAHTNRNFFVQFSVAVAVVIGYFLAMFILGNNYIGDIQELSKEMANSARLEATFSFAQNAQREMLYNPDKPVLKGNSFNAAQEVIGFIYNNTQEMLNSHQEQRNLLNSGYLSQFHDLLNGNLCTSDLINTQLIPELCPALFNNATLYGIQSVLTQYYETMRQTLSISRILGQNGTASGFRTRWELLNSRLYVDLYLMQFRFIQDTFRLLVEMLGQAVNDDFQSDIDTRISAFIIYIMGIVIAYLILWTPFLNKLNREIWRTKTMLTIIPIEIIMKMPKLQEYLNKQAIVSSGAKKGNASATKA